MPKSLPYSAGSVIYFQGDIAENIFLLQSGSVTLTYSDIETGKDIRETLSKGEFFGVKSALGRYPREETATVSQNSVVVSFSTVEFEEIALKNSGLIMKMLKVFSNQLRRTHKQVASLMNNNEIQTPEEGIFATGKFYFKNKKYAYAMHIFGKYLTYYPHGRHGEEARSNLNAAISFIAKYGDGLDTEGILPASMEELGEKHSLSSAADYAASMRLIEHGNYSTAYQTLKKIVDGNDPEFAAKSAYQIGRCFFLMDKFDDCTKYYAQTISKYPKHKALPEMLFLMGQSYERIGKEELASSFYTKGLSLIENKNETLYVKMARALAILEGK